MKKIITIVIGFLFLQATSGPKHDVCGPYDPNRTLEQFKKAVLDTTNTFMVTQLWPAYVYEINLMMKESKDSNVRRMVFKPKLKDMQFILHYSKDVHYSLIDWKNYINSHKESNKLVFQDEQGNLSNGVFFEYKDVSDLYSKIACFNAAKKKRKKEVIPEEKKITPDPVLASNCCTTLIYIDNSISNSFNTNTTTENSNNTTTSTASTTTSTTTSTSTPVAQKLGTDYRSSNLGTDYRSTPTYYSSTYNQPAPIVYSRDPVYYTAPAPVPLPSPAPAPQPRPVPRETPPHASGPPGRTTPGNNAGGAGGRDATGNNAGGSGGRDATGNNAGGSGGRDGNNGSGMRGRGG